VHTPPTRGMTTSSSPAIRHMLSAPLGFHPLEASRYNQSVMYLSSGSFYEIATSTHCGGLSRTPNFEQALSESSVSATASRQVDAWLPPSCCCSPAHCCTRRPLKNPPGGNKWSPEFRYSIGSIGR
jgi:hypothetical protein